MPSLDNIPAAVTAYLAGTRAPRIQEIVRVAWERGTNVKYYSSTAVHDIPGFTTLASLGITSVEPRFKANQFLDIPLSAGFSDDVITLDFWDADSVISDLYRLSGEGTKITVYYFLPEVTPTPYLAEYFWGLLRAPKESDGERFKVEVTEGLGSPSVQIPKRVIYAGCQATFGGLVNIETSTPYFTTQAQIDENDCPYNRHIGGSFGTLNGGAAWTSCPKRNRQDCIDRLGDDLSYLAFDVLVETVRFGKNNRFIATTHANETAANQPLNVIYGYRHVSPMTLLAYRSETHAGGFTVTVCAVCEGEVEQIFGFGMNNIYTPFEHMEVRNGAKRQVPMSYTVTNQSFSGTAVLRQTTPTNKTVYTPDNITCHGFVQGLKVRVYSNPTTYVKQYSNNRAWCLLDMMTSRRYGLGYDHARFQIQDFIDVAAWSDQDVLSVNEQNAPVSASVPAPTDPETGNPRGITGATGVNGVSARRTQLDVNIKGGDARQIIRDWCLAGRYGLPFHYNGKIRLVGLLQENIATAPFFRDYGTARNIIWENNKSTLRWSSKSDEEIINQVKVTFDNEAYNWAEHPILYGDEHQQLAAGKRFGDDTKRVLEKEYALFGVTRFHEAVRTAKMLLDLGEFDEGGLENNLEVKFKTWFTTVANLKIHKYRIIAVDNPKVNAFTERTSGSPFLYFRVKKIRRLPNLQCEVTAQAYPATYYGLMEMGVIITVGIITAPTYPITVKIPTRPRNEPVTVPGRRNDHIVVRVG